MLVPFILLRKPMECTAANLLSVAPIESDCTVEPESNDRLPERLVLGKGVALKRFATS